MAKFDIHDNTFNQHTSVIKNYYESSFRKDDVERYVDELRRIRENDFANSSSIAEAISQLTSALENKSKEATKKTVKKYVGDLLSDVFKSVASASLIEYIKTFL